MSKTNFFGLREISDWQLRPSTSSVQLPPLQRGFVWKPSQIEQLWDSILRGFPIGSFLLARDEREQLLLLDGQQRATSVTLGFYDPWEHVLKEERFWSLKNIPVVWIDLSPTELTQSQKYVVRVVTRSHPWGYQRVDHTKTLSISDRKNALSIFEENPENKGKNYVDFDPRSIFPYDADLPVPLPFLIESILDQREEWKEHLLARCKSSFPKIKTKHTSIDFFDKLTNVLDHFSDNLYRCVLKLEAVQIPGIVVDREILNVDDDDSAQDPTLFVRLNSSGTRIAGDELIYSIYKAAYPEAKTLIENIGQNYVAPSVVISVVVRLVYSSINENAYPAPLTVNDFKKRIKDHVFRKKLQEFIGSTSDNSVAGELFDRAIRLLRCENQINMPTMLVKSIVNSSSDLLMMLLQSVRFCDSFTSEEYRRVLGAVTALHWFCEDKRRYVQRVWNNIPKGNEFWSSTNLAEPFYGEENPLIHPFLTPPLLEETLLENVVERGTTWNNLYPSRIMDFFKKVSHPPIEGGGDSAAAMWDNFANKLFWCKAMILFAQRTYINDNFGEFNSMDILEDTNTPWDWDHIYPDSWIRRNWYINANTKHWNNCIGNFRALALEENRSENNTLSPSERLADPNIRVKSFVNDEDYFQYWNKIKERINEDKDDLVKIHLKSVINRLCDIYSEWYHALEVGTTFGIEKVKNDITSSLNLTYDGPSTTVS